MENMITSINRIKDEAIREKFLANAKSLNCMGVYAVFGEDKVNLELGDASLNLTGAFAYFLTPEGDDFWHDEISKVLAQL